MFPIGCVDKRAKVWRARSSAQARCYCWQFSILGDSFCGTAAQPVFGGRSPDTQADLTQGLYRDTDTPIKCICV